MKKYRLLLWTALVAVLGATALYSARTDIFTLQGEGSLRNVDVFRISSTGDVTFTDSSSYNAFNMDSTTGELSIYSGDVNLGANASQPSTSNFYGLKVSLKNCGSTSWVAGNLVIVDDSAAGCGAVGTATTDLTDWVGIAEGTVAAGSIGYVTVGGYALALTTGTVNRGDTLVSTTSAAGYLTGDSTPTTGADVGVALSSGTAAGGTTLIRVR